MSDTDLLFMPAVKAAALIRAKKLSPVDYVDTVLKAIERTQPRLNCFRVVMAEQARRDAKEAEEAVARGDKLGPLHGVPFGVKDLVVTKGVRTTFGTPLYRDNVPTEDAPMVERLKAEGPLESLAVMHGSAPADAEKLREQLLGEMPGMEIEIGQIGAVLGTHTGPRALGLVYVKK